MISLKGIEKVYRTDKIETTALRNIDLEVAQGELVSVMGPSGCGKSTLLNIMGLLDKPTHGEVLIENALVNNYGDIRLAKLRNQKIGFIFQSFHLINDLSVVDNVELPLIYRLMPNKKRRELALAALERVGLSTRTRHFPNQLSGGQRQRVAIARAIVGNPEIILADEPTGNLDSVMGNEIMDILLMLNQEQGTTIVMVTHDEHLAIKTQRVIRLFDGAQVS
ncbi:MAG: ABC transporter ATP-binding protein [Candidatus Cloacimonetes bacterium]|nr:ABC transporter ATP-binding protein [Candidatus Cloacimonadota bacterium]